MLSFTPRPLYPLENKLGVPQNRSGSYEEGIMLPCQALNPGLWRSIRSQIEEVEDNEMDRTYRTHDGDVRRIRHVKCRISSDETKAEN
jgi:hypothetical protein